jgi:hypothetical protein
MSETMTKLKLGPIPDDKPVRLTIIISAELAALLRTYADAVGSGNSNPVTVERIIPPILERTAHLCGRAGTLRTALRVRQSHQRQNEADPLRSARLKPSRAILRNRPTSPGGGSMSCFRAITA